MKLNVMLKSVVIFHILSGMYKVESDFDFFPTPLFDFFPKGIYKYIYRPLFGFDFPLPLPGGGKT